LKTDEIYRKLDKPATLTDMKRFRTLIQSVLLAEGFVIVTVAAFRWLDTEKSQNIVDVLFLEGALLIVAGGLGDLSKSITFSHIRAMIKSNSSVPPPIKKARLAGILLISGLLICAHAVIWIYL
jgi:uncharacterized membrane protein YidH (DUF202 family)